METLLESSVENEHRNIFRTLELFFFSATLPPHVITHESETPARHRGTLSSHNQSADDKEQVKCHAASLEDI